MTVLCLNAQTDSKQNETELLKKKNEEVVSFFKEGKYKNAEESAIEAVGLAVRIFGEHHSETATQYSNLGEIYRMREKYEKAVENYDKALAIYRTNEERYAEKMLNLLDSKGTVLAFDKKKDEAKAVFSEYLTKAETKYGTDSLEILPHLKKLVSFYLYIKDFDQADEFLIRRNIIIARAGGRKRVEVDDLEDEIFCYLHNHFKWEEVLARQTRIAKAVSDALGNELKPADSKEVKRISGGVVNGKAARLVYPEYPEEARLKRIKGTVLVKILINEEGKVISAKAMCGPSVLQQAAVDAANKTKFETTYLSGKPVEVSGFIIYSFQ